MLRQLDDVLDSFPLLRSISIAVGTRDDYDACWFSRHYDNIIGLRNKSKIFELFVSAVYWYGFSVPSSFLARIVPSARGPSRPQLLRVYLESCKHLSVLDVIRAKVPEWSEAFFAEGDVPDIGCLVEMLVVENCPHILRNYPMVVSHVLSDPTESIVGHLMNSGLAVDPDLVVSKILSHQYPFVGPFDCMVAMSSIANCLLMNMVIRRCRVSHEKGIRPERARWQQRYALVVPLLGR
jgi:hypothetical protein